MSMVNLYVEAIGQRLPMKNREDLKREIRSLVEDSIEDAAQGQEVTEDLVIEVIKKFGSPDKVAASYQSPKYLIGPNLYPTFMLVARIVFVVIAIISAIGIGISIGRTETQSTQLLGEIGKGILEMINSVILSLAYVVLTFSVIQWISPNIKFDEEAWDPRSLKAEPDQDEVKPAGVAVEIFFTLALLVLLNLYSEWIGLNTFADGKWLHAPVLSSAFDVYLPWINLSLIGGIVLDGLLIRSGKWTQLLQWFSVVLTIGSIVLLGFIIAGPSLIAINTAELVQNGWPQEFTRSLGQISTLVTVMFRVALGIALMMNVIEVVKKLYRIGVAQFSRQPSLTSK